MKTSAKDVATILLAVVCANIPLSVLAADAPPARMETPQAPEPSSAPGASVDELLAIARAMNPGLAAAALEAQAAQARVGTTGRYPDPVFKSTLWDVRAARNGLPERVDQVWYTVEQTVPLWGKLDLQRKVAIAEARAASEQRGSVEVELAARIKTVFAGHYGTNESIRINRELLDTVSAIALVAESRYGQGQGSQADAVTAEVERGRLQAELARLDGERRTWIAQTNALLNRPLGAPLAPPEALRPLPDPEMMRPEQLLERSRQANPQLASEQAVITAAERSAELVRRNWYPDPTFSLTLQDQNGSNGNRQFFGYMAEISITIPLQWGLRRAQEGEALARAAASRTRREATAADLQGQLEGAVAAFEAARKSEKILTDINIPQSKVVLRSALAGYQLGRADLPSVLLAEQAVLRVTLDRVALLVEEQLRLAEIERIVGGEL